MSDHPACEAPQLELSIAHDEQRPADDETLSHLVGCPRCSRFALNLIRLDARLARGEVGLAPDVSARVAQTMVRPRTRWWMVAAVGMVGIAIGAVMAGVGSLDAVQAQDLDERFHAASPSVPGLTAEMVVVERGWHPDVPERVYDGTLRYAAPERLALVLDDTTSYPGQEWTPNDVELRIADGDLVAVASSPCPTEALPHCQREPTVTAFRDLRPFDPGVTAPLEIVGPAGSFSWWSGLSVVGFPVLDGLDTIQVEATVAAVDLLSAITDHGAWRSLHPSDRVVMWLDQSTLVPLRVEVFATDSPERDLWAVRRGYLDPLDEAIFIVALANLSTAVGEFDVDTPDIARSGGFEDRPVDGRQPTLDVGFEPHRSGRWLLPDTGRVDVSSWSDGRSWVVVETTADWRRPGVFGLAAPFAQRIDLGDGSVGYLDPSGAALAIHTDDLDVVVRGSATTDTLLAVARSLDLVGRAVPDDWPQASVVEVDELPPGTLVPDVDGWSILGAVTADRTEILLTGAGSRRVVVSSQPGDRLDPPVGPDVVAVEVRDLPARFDAATSTLEWMEDGRVVGMRSDTVSRSELEQLAESMRAIR